MLEENDEISLNSLFDDFAGFDVIDELVEIGEIGFDGLLQRYRDLQKSHCDLQKSNRDMESNN